MSAALLPQALDAVAPDSMLAFCSDEFIHYWSRVMRRFGQRLVPADDLDDLLQDVWTNVLQHIKKKAPPSDNGLRAWFERIIRNEAIDHARRRRVRRAERIDDLVASQQEPAEHGLEPAALWDVRWRIDRFRVVLDDLSAKLGSVNCRIVEACCLEQRQHADIADELGLSAHQVRDRLSAARQRVIMRLGVYVDDAA